MDVNIKSKYIVKVKNISVTCAVLRSSGKPNLWRIDFFCFCGSFEILMVNLIY